MAIVVNLIIVAIDIVAIAIVVDQLDHRRPNWCAALDDEPTSTSDSKIHTLDYCGASIAHHLFYHELPRTKYLPRSIQIETYFQQQLSTLIAHNLFTAIISKPYYIYIQRMK